MVLQNPVPKTPLLQYFFSPLTVGQYKSMGPRTLAIMEKMGIKTVWDALCFFPHKYIRYLPGLSHTGPAYVDCVCMGVNTHMKKKWTVYCRTNTHDNVEITYFHKPFFLFFIGKKIRIYGTFIRKNNAYHVVHPDKVTDAENDDVRIFVEPVYSVHPPFSSFRMHTIIINIIASWPKETEDFFTPWKERFIQAHCPTYEIENGEWQMGFRQDTWCAQYYMQCLTHSIVVQSSDVPSMVVKSDTWEKTLRKNFGKCLTLSQERAYQEIVRDMKQPHTMRRVLYGDVGTGKTIVAFLAVSHAADGGYKACIMAPLESLALQHYHNINRLLPDLPVQLVCAGKKIGHENPQVVIGTHALIYPSITLTDTRLVIIDEQHRFGVMQRAQLCAKAGCPHVLYMSATPIPRTLEKIKCGHVQVSMLEKRENTVPPSTYIVSMKKMEDMRLFMQKTINTGGRIYWVCPTIEGKHHGVNVRTLNWKEYFPDHVTCLHGNMSLEEKKSSLDDFISGKKPLLVCTTIIEVGLDVPEATVIFIEESTSFGLAQLHQLRGRVGRGFSQGHCFLLYSTLSQTSMERLAFLKTSCDGHVIAEKDWAIRGAGHALGKEQSGHHIPRILSFADVHPPVNNVSPEYIKAWYHWIDNHPDQIWIMRLFGYEMQGILS